MCALCCAVSVNSVFNEYLSTYCVMSNCIMYSIISLLHSCQTSCMSSLTLTLFYPTLYSFYPLISPPHPTRPNPARLLNLFQVVPTACNFAWIRLTSCTGT